MKCPPGQPPAWWIKTLKPTLDVAMKAEVLKKVKAAGFDPEGALPMSYASCAEAKM
jgi:hypothetical protein